MGAASHSLRCCTLLFIPAVLTTASSCYGRADEQLNWRVHKVNSLLLLYNLYECFHRLTQGVTSAGTGVEWRGRSFRRKLCPCQDDARRQGPA